MSPRARCFLAALLLAGCELSLEGRGPVPTVGSDQNDARNEPEPAASDAHVRESDPDASVDGARDGDPVDATAMPADDDAGSDPGAAPDAAIDAPDSGAAATGETVFVSVGGENNIPWLYTSCDGHTWLRRVLSLPAGHPTAGEGAGLRGIGYGAGTFVITGGGSVNGGNARLLARSVDGVNWQWEQRPLSCTDCQWMGGAAFLDDGKGGGVWIAGGGIGTRLFSRDDGRSWQTSSTQGMAPYRRFRSAGARAVGAGQGVLTVVELAAPGASEPVLWHDSAQPIAHESVYIAAGNGAFVVIWYDDGCRFLREGDSFEPCDLPSGHDPVLTSVVFGNGKFSILGRGAPIESSDGEHWTLANSGDGADFRDVTYAAGSYVTPRAYSSDAIAWEDASPPASNASAIAAGRLAAGQSCPR
jgi:hypothetical protein